MYQAIEAISAAGVINAGLRLLAMEKGMAQGQKHPKPSQNMPKQLCKW